MVGVILVSGIDIIVYQDKHNRLTKRKFKDKGSVVTYSNHVSEIDPLFFCALFSWLYPNDYQTLPFAKEDVASYPIINGFLLLSNAIFVYNRDNKPHNNQHKYIQKKLSSSKGKRNILIFIEGTTFSEKVRDERNKKAKLSNIPSTNNVLKPHTSGLHLIEANSDITMEIQITLKFIGHDGDTNPDWQWGIYDMIIGRKPKKVLIYVCTKDLNRKLLTNRKEYNNRIYKNFKEVDDRLGKGISCWDNNYLKEHITLRYSDMLWFVIYSIFGIITPYLLFTNIYYGFYFLFTIGFYMVMGEVEKIKLKHPNMFLNN
jgi:1-acyl-sn-glycerol-3-phosphate acyltransferase